MKIFIALALAVANLTDARANASDPVVREGNLLRQELRHSANALTKMDAALAAAKNAAPSGGTVFDAVHWNITGLKADLLEADQSLKADIAILAISPIRCGEGKLNEWKAALDARRRMRETVRKIRAASGKADSLGNSDENFKTLFSGWKKNPKAQLSLETYRGKQAASLVEIKKRLKAGLGARSLKALEELPEKTGTECGPQSASTASSPIPEFAKVQPRRAPPAGERKPMLTGPNPVPSPSKESKPSLFGRLWGGLQDRLKNLFRPKPPQVDGLVQKNPDGTTSLTFKSKRPWWKFWAPKWTQKTVTLEGTPGEPKKNVLTVDYLKTRPWWKLWAPKNEKKQLGVYNEFHGFDYSGPKAKPVSPDTASTKNGPAEDSAAAPKEIEINPAASAALSWSAEQMPDGNGTGVNSNNSKSTAKNQHAWDAWCLAFVATAYGRNVENLKAPSAIASYNKFNRAGKIVNSKSDIPPGAPIFFSATPSNNNWGHIAIFTGRYAENGEPIMRTTGWHSWPGIHEITISEFEKKGGAKYTGYGVI